MKKYVLLTSIIFWSLITQIVMWQQFCIQITQPAYNPRTWECKVFPTPCQVPTGWIKVNGCSKDKFTEIKTKFEYLTPEIENQIDQILNKKLFSKIKKLDLKQQLYKLEKINQKVVNAIEKIEKIYQKNPSKKYKFILEVLLYVQQKISYKIQNIKFLLSEF